MPRRKKIVETKGKSYVLMEVGWQYNDENHFRPQDDGGVPQTVYSSKVGADQECKRLNEIERKNHLSGSECDFNVDGRDLYYEVENGDITNEEAWEAVPFYEVVEVDRG